MYVIGTAGHVDHGKSTLVEALTGIDPDRLREEKERGLTIDLGFAWLSLPSGNEVSIVDVPGHERFVNNMLAGVGGIDMALLVVAADESVMPQTREHLAILDLLGVDRGIVAVTKRDLVDDELADLVAAEVEDVLSGTTLVGSKILTVSGTTRAGLPELVAAVDEMLEQAAPKKDVGRPRLPIDRSFTISGFGTVVTGTLIDGRLDVGQEVELVPSGKTARVRGLQTHKQKVERAEPGTRVAANLSGVAHDEISRGEVLATPGWLKATTAIDVHLRTIPDAPRAVRHNMFATVHTGSSETVARVRLLEKDSAGPGDSTWAQLKLDNPVAAVRGDHFVVRSNQTTLGGGNIVEPNARRHRRNYKPILDRLAVLEMGSDRDILLSGIESSQPADFPELVSRTNLQPAKARSELTQMASEKLVIILGNDKMGAGTSLFTAGGWSQVADRAGAFVEDFHKQHPLRKGVAKEELRSRLGMSPRVFNLVLPLLEQEAVLVDEGSVVRRPDHAREIPGAKEGEVEEYLKLLELDRYSPPTDAPVDPELLNLLAEQGKVVKVSDSVVFSASAYQEMADTVSNLIRERGQVTVGDVRDAFGTSRKYALALLDYLDQQKLTRRVGDARVLR